MIRIFHHMVIGALLAAVIHVLVPVEILGRFTSQWIGCDVPDSKDYIASPPPFINVKLMLKAHSVTSLGYECFESIPSMFERAPVEVTAKFEWQVRDIKAMKAHVCRNQQRLAVELLEYVEALWKISLSPPPRRGARFTYGTFHREALSDSEIATELSARASSFREDFKILSSKVLDLLDRVTLQMLDVEITISESMFLEEFAIVATTASLVSNGIAVLTGVLNSHLDQLEQKIWSKTGDDGDVLHLLEALYASGLWFFVRDQVMRDFC